MGSVGGGGGVGVQLVEEEELVQLMEEWVQLVEEWGFSWWRSGFSWWKSGGCSGLDTVCRVQLVQGFYNEWGLVVVEMLGWLEEEREVSWYVTPKGF